MQSVPFVLSAHALRAVDIASAATLDLDSVVGDYVQVTGTTGVTAVNLSEGKTVWVRFSGALTLTNGANLALPGGLNISTNAGDWVRFVAIGSVVYVNGYLANLQPVTANTVQAIVPPMPGAFRNKAIDVTGNTGVSVTCDYLWATNGSGAFKLLAINSPAVSLAAAGAIDQLAAGLTIAANTFYYVWGVCKSDGSGAGVVIGTSVSTPPTLPAGYSGGFTAYMGCLRTASGSAQLMGTKQRGRRTSYIVGLAQTTASVILCSGSQGTLSTVSPTLAANQVRGNGFFVPPHVDYITIGSWTSWKAGPGSGLQLATSLQFSGTNNGNTGSAGMLSLIGNDPGTNVGKAPFPVFLESDNLYFAGNGTGCAVVLFGWEENY